MCVAGIDITVMSLEIDVPIGNLEAIAMQHGVAQHPQRRRCESILRC